MMATAIAAPPIIASRPLAMLDEAPLSWVWRPGAGPVVVASPSEDWVGWTTAVAVTVTSTPSGRVDVLRNVEVNSVVVEESVVDSSVVVSSSDVEVEDVEVALVVDEVGSGEELVGSGSVDVGGSEVVVVVLEGGCVVSEVGVGSGSGWDVVLVVVVVVGSGSVVVVSDDVVVVVVGSGSGSVSLVEVGGSEVSESVEVGLSVTVPVGAGELLPLSCLFANKGRLGKATF
jgi:hypothetical protein